MDSYCVVPPSSRGNGGAAGSTLRQIREKPGVKAPRSILKMIFLVSFNRRSFLHLKVSSACWLAHGALATFVWGPQEMREGRGQRRLTPIFLIPIQRLMLSSFAMEEFF